MAGDWTAMEHATISKPEMLTIIHLTGRDRHQCLGLMMHFWSWAETVTTDGLVSVPLVMLPTVIGANIEFWRAVVQAGWIEIPDGEDSPPIFIPRAEHWLTHGAKSRLKNSKRQKRHRDTTGDTEVSRSERDKSATKARPQNRTEENRTDTRGESPPTGDSPSLNLSSESTASESEPTGTEMQTARLERRSARNGTELSSAFDRLTEDDLRDTSALSEWLKWQGREYPNPVIKAPTSDSLRNVLAAAEQALTKGADPLSLFRTIVGKRRFDKLPKAARDGASKRFEAYQRTRRESA